MSQLVGSVRFMIVACVLATFGCRSLDGLSGGAKEDAGGDATADSSVPPSCVASAELGSLCIRLAIDESRPSPGYGAFSGADGIGVDGNGFVQVLLFDKDPTDPANGHVLPKATLRHPASADSTMTIDALPLELVGNAAAGLYWVYALFEDNASDARGTGLLSALPGDFVTPQDVNNTVSIYPQVTLTAGETTKLELALVPARALTVMSKASTTLLQAASANPTIHGDGPAGIMIYDGNLTTGAPTVVDFRKAPCIDLQLQNPARPETVSVTLTLTSTGTHNVYANVYDYQNPDIENVLIPPGTVLTDAAFPPQLTVQDTSWSVSLEVTFTGVHEPKIGSVTDPLHCN